MTLLDLPTFDGGRQFTALPQTTDPMTLRKHIARLPGVTMGALVYSVSESWIDFTLEGHSFSVNDQYGEYWFFVANPAAPDELLERVVSHATTLLGDLDEGRARLDRQTLAFGYGFLGAVLGVVMLHHANLSWVVLTAAAPILFVGTRWLATAVLRRRASRYAQRRSSGDVHSASG